MTSPISSLAFWPFFLWTGLDEVGAGGLASRGSRVRQWFTLTVMFIKMLMMQVKNTNSFQKKMTSKKFSVDQNFTIDFRKLKKPVILIGRGPW